MRRIIFCGTRQCIPGAKEKILAVLAKLDSGQTTIIHGGCSGVDATAGQEALALGFPVEVFRADWRAHGKAAGPMRNKEMLDSGANFVYAFPYPSLKKSKGTRNMVVLAKKAGIAVEIHQIE